MPKIIKKNSKSYLELSFEIYGFFSESIYMKFSFNGGKVSNYIMPINFLIFCKIRDLSMNEFNERIKKLEEKKLEGEFVLDFRNIKTYDDILEILNIDKCVKAFLSEDKTRVMGYTCFKYSEKTEFFCFFIIETQKNLMHSNLKVYSSNYGFRDVVTRNLLDILAYFP